MAQTIKNYDRDLAKAKAAVMNRAKAADNGYAQESLVFWGEKSVARYIQEYPNCENYWGAPEDIPTDGKTRAKSVRIIDGADVYVDLRDKEATPSLTGRGTICTIIEFDGAYYEFYKGYGDKTYTVYEFNAPRISCDDLPSGWEDSHPKPNGIGVITDSKMLQWAEYRRERRNAAREEKKRREKAIAAALRSIVKIERVAEKSWRDASGMRGEIVKNGICYKWQISEKGVIYDELRIYYTVGSDGVTFRNTRAADFLAMAKGKLKTRFSR